jgi:quercetin dioxygenase-like cupin family protein
MRRFGVLASVIAVMLLGMLALHAQPVAVAQEASPAAGGMMEPEGVTFEPIAISSGLTLPNPAEMIAARFRIQPGAALPLDANDPSGGMLIVESGTFTVRVDTPWAISRSGSFASSIATAEASGTFTSQDEQVASGDEASMGAGDAAYIPGSVSGEIRNDGDQEAVALVVLVGPTEDMMGGATPTP